MELVFISYSSRDQLFVNRLTTDLRDRGVPYWVDREHIPVGERWDRVLEEALHRATHLVFVLSKFSVESENVRDEYHFAREHKLKIVPLRIDDTAPPLRMMRHQYIDFSEDYEKHLQDLLALLPTQQSMRTSPFSQQAIQKAAAIEAAIGEDGADDTISAPGDPRNTDEIQVVTPEEKPSLENQTTVYPILHFEGQNYKRSWRMRRTVVTMGRHEKCDLMFNSGRISRFHLQVMQSKGTYYVKDLGSTNGTWLNDVRLEKEAVQPLKNGDVIDIAHRIKVSFELPEIPSRRATEEFMPEDLQ